MRPTGYQGPIRHLYATITRDHSQPRFLAHEPHTPLGSHAELRVRLRLRQQRGLQRGSAGAARSHSPRPRPAEIIRPRRSAPIGSFVSLRAALARSCPHGSKQHPYQCRRRKRSDRHRACSACVSESCRYQCRRRERQSPWRRRRYPQSHQERRHQEPCPQPHQYPYREEHPRPNRSRLILHTPPYV